MIVRKKIGSTRRTGILYLENKYSMRDVISHCVWRCDMGKISVHDKKLKEILHVCTQNVCANYETQAGRFSNARLPGAGVAVGSETNV